MHILIFCMRILKSISNDESNMKSPYFGMKFHFQGTGRVGMYRTAAMISYVICKYGVTSWLLYAAADRS